jgi:hypothetical protein
MESSMRRILPIATAILLLGAAPAVAQSTLMGPAPAGMGMTSPLGSTSPVGQAGIPLGSTELVPGGLSPAPLGATATSSCGANGMPVTAATTAGTGGSSSTFDGGGISGGTSVACGSTPPGGTASGTQTQANSGMAGGSTVGSGAIPLGATELGGTGISPMEPGPTLDFPAPCVESGTTTTGMSDPTQSSGC